MTFLTIGGTGSKNIVCKKNCSQEKESEYTVPAINTELVFRRVLVISECRDDLSLENVPIGAVPSSMFHEDGTIRINVNQN